MGDNFTCRCEKGFAGERCEIGENCKEVKNLKTIELIKDSFRKRRFEVSLKINGMAHPFNQNIPPPCLQKNASIIC